MALSRLILLPVSTPSVIRMMALRPTSRLQFVVGGQIDGVIKNRPGLILHGGHRAGMQAAYGDAQAQLLQAFLQEARGVGQSPARARLRLRIG